VPLMLIVIMLYIVMLNVVAPMSSLAQNYKAALTAYQ
jgi:hypothetical protein